ncbi:hypothetical protein CONPUDRAFT_144316 [Coniophora puteana RWD-64-598 SS2]|uniref:RNI-like protein n=1 Tax=Coniophora puteana (strain RWD-64-598) TaxID=741705 RepID=A0A5M3MR15_CONPW|nr:uncharacterized protein CONPUDRAFT_144316 [Coniophora puteana RWD-64-598 SS2]EIW81623.1 hypothetical protein CONPUDRAFT_144316 [Coniophora puteana RWD-64-598 SS2]
MTSPSHTPSAHKVIRLQELVDIIFIQLEGEENDTTDLQCGNDIERIDSQLFQTLASLARTSQIFRVPATKYLWMVQFNIKPLLKLLPQDLWEENNGIFKFSGKRIITREDMLRINELRPRVLHLLDLTGDGLFSGIDTSSMSVISEFWPKPLLPNLRTIRSNSALDTIGLDPLIYVGSALSSMEFCFGTWDERRLRALRLLPSACLNLRVLRIGDFDFDCIYPGGMNPLVSDLLSTALRGLWHLTRLETCPPDRMAMQHLTRLTSLDTLRFEITQDDVYVPEGGYTHIFPETLRTLEVMTNSTESASNLLRSLVASPENLEIDFGFGDNLAGTRDLLSFIPMQMNNRKGGLKSLSLRARDQQYNHAISNGSLCMMDLEPIMELTRLTTLDISLTPRVNLDDGDLLRLAQALPLLEDLRLGNGTRTITVPTAVAFLSEADLAGDVDQRHGSSPTIS